MCPERARYGAQQAELLRALWRGEGFPAGFEDANASAASRALIRKRGRAVTGAWPALTQCLGQDFMAAFERFARSTPPTSSGGGFTDGLAFALSLDRDALTDDARSELLLARGSIRERDPAAGRRRGLFIAANRLRHPHRVLVVVHLPWLGTRYVAIAIPTLQRRPGV